jgi:hypothetical protein
MAGYLFSNVNSFIDGGVVYSVGSGEFLMCEGFEEFDPRCFLGPHATKSEKNIYAPE